MKIFRNWYKSLEIDPFMLGAARIILCMVILYDLWLLFPNIATFYSSSGIHPFETSKLLMSEGHWSIYSFLQMKNLHQYIFFTCAGAVFFTLIGFKTKFFMLISWICLNSLIFRNQGILQYSDYIKSLALFWFLLLPTNKKFIIGKPTNLQSYHIFTLGFIFNIILFYFMPSFFRSYEQWYLKADALFYALGNVVDQTPFTHYVDKWNLDKKLLSRFIYIFEFSAPFFLLLGRRIRNLTAFLLILFHIGIALILKVNTFSAVMVAILIPLINLSSKQKRNKLYLDRTITNHIIGALIIFIMAGYNLPIFMRKNIPKPFEIMNNILNIGYKWEMYVLHHKNTYWFRLLGITKDKKHYDLLNPKKRDYFDDEISANESLYIRDRYWNNYLNFAQTTIRSGIKYRKVPQTLLYYFCKQNPPKIKVESISFVEVKKPIRKKESSSKEKAIFRYDCRGK